MGRKQVLTTLTVKNTQEGIINTIETPTYTFDPPGANKALELMGKYLGMFSDKVELTGENGNPVQTEHKGVLDFSKMTDDEVRLFIELGNKAACI